MDYLVFDIEGGRMIDFHSHVLPGIDDGSDCVEESLEMLHTAKKQGVSMMLATPHFYRSEERRVGKECRSRWSPYH